MKKIYALVLVSGLAVAPQSHAEGWLDSLKGLFGNGALYLNDRYNNV